MSSIEELKRYVKEHQDYLNNGQWKPDNIIKEEENFIKVFSELIKKREKQNDAA
jgi:hypothetical protein